jgi:hypothetical protein
VSFIVLLLLVLVGIGVFFSPQLFLHRALLDAKRSKVTSIQKEYEEIHRSIEQENGSSEDLSLCLEVTDRRLENAKSIRTWPYDILSVGKLAAASLIPWLTLSQKILALPIGS